jgi:hypothetical protein
MTFKTTNPQCGDIYLVHITGAVGAGIELGQKLVGSSSYFTHAGVVGPDGNFAVAAQPGGAIQTSLADGIGSGRVVYSAFDLTVKQRSDIWSAAQSYLGTPYSFADYAAIAALRLCHTDAIELFVGATGHMICSQLAAQCYLDAGIKLFPNRVPGDVAPGDIANLIGAK